ncbi:hypothetical protein BYT27DRAFT_7191755 [Phlegmacium glaucopus]|nr:hypothetical protein BYT27DRAFT_7191755 [Phlegmacium glaucopus]
MNAEYIFPSRPDFEKVATETAAGEESDVNGLWCSNILQTYFTYKPSVPTYVMKPEVTHGNSRYDILVTRQIITGHGATWPWVLIYEGKKAGVAWDVVRRQMFNYFQTSGHRTLYGIGAVGRKCKFWEWDPAHGGTEYQLQKNHRGQVVARSGQFPESDIVTDNRDIEDYIKFIKARMV